MRELKFRAWDKRGKSWLYPWPSGFHIFGEATCFDMIGDQMHERYPDESRLLLMNDVEITQFTGLLDKTGKDIYEGDILRWKDDDPPRVFEYIEPVEFIDACFYFRNHWSSSVGEIVKDEQELVEIIGNIHENPDLISC